MKKEPIEGGGAAYTGLYEEDGTTWNVIVRAGGSISLYATRPGESCHYVVFDTLDEMPPNEIARPVIARLAEMVEGVTLLLAAAKEASEPQHTAR